MAQANISKGKFMDSGEILCMMELWLKLQTILTLNDIWPEKIRGIDFCYIRSFLFTANIVSKSAGTDAMLCKTQTMT